jgi:two-component system, NarL family, sensor histidine kinase UhpB
MSLFWRVFLANAAILAAGIVVAAFLPVKISDHASLPEIADLAVALAAMVFANWLALRPLFRPLERLARRMESADVLVGAQRVPTDSPGEVGSLESAFNEMMERLEAERREAGGRALHAQEEERRRIARGLHDEVGQTMTGVLFQLRRLAQDATPEQQPVLASTQEAVRASLEEVRRVAQELRPEVLDHLGLSSALVNLSRTFADRTGIRVRRHFDERLPALAPDVELAVYRVAQESLTNAAKHSGAEEILLALEDDDDGLVLRVADNGHGFNGRLVEGGGLRGIREHALIAGGTVAIGPRRTGGVEVRLRVPAADAPQT